MTAPLDLSPAGLFALRQSVAATFKANRNAYAAQRTADLDRCADCGELPEPNGERCGNCADRRDGVVRSTRLEDDIGSAP